MFRPALLAFAATFAPAAEVNADLVFQMDFSFSNFVTGVGSASPPQDPVTGTLFFQADDINSDVTSIDGISLTINGHTYTTAELAFFNRPPTHPTDDSYIGASTGGAAGMNGIGSSHDFWISWNTDTLIPNEFVYQSQGISGRFFSSTSDVFTITQAVPEPSSLLLVGIGVALPIVRRRRKPGVRRTPP